MTMSTPFKWFSSCESGHFVVFQWSAPFVLVAPGRQILTDLIERRSLPNGAERKSLELPDDDLISYAQSVPPERDETVLAFVMIEWCL